MLVTLIALTFLSELASAQSSAAARKVLVLYWYGKDYPGNVAFDRAFQAALQSDPTSGIEYFAEYLESDRLPEQAQQLVLREYLRHKYADVSFDVVVASGFVTQRFLIANRELLFPNVPLVFVSSLDPPQEQLATGAGITGVLAYRSHEQVLDMILRIHPGTERVFVISGTRERDLQFEAVARRELAEYQDIVDITYLTDLPPDELIARTRTLPERSAILYVWQQVELEPGRMLEPADILSLIAPTASAPIYGMSGALIGRGIVGGEVFTIEAVATRIAEMTLRISSGERAQNIPVEHAPTGPTFDWNALQRWEIPEGRLPSGSIIQFRDPALWQRYQWQLIAAAIALTVQSALIVGLLWQHRLRRRAEQQLHRQQRELFHLNRVATLGEFTGTLAHELRQPLTAILFNARAAQHLLARDTFERELVEESLAGVVHAEQRAVDVIDRLRGHLRKTETRRETLDLNDVVREAIDIAQAEFETRSVSVSFEPNTSALLVMADRIELQQVLLNLFLNACDAMSTVQQQSRGLRVRTARDSDGSLRVSVIDRGPGIASENKRRVFQPFFTSKVDGLGLGLAICRTIIAEHGGDMWVDDHPGEGASVSFSLPPYDPARGEVTSRSPVESAIR
jgi:signal transduction histidine kinase